MLNLNSISLLLASTIAISSTTASAATIPSSFYLVTTTSRNSAHNSSHLNNVSAISIFDPIHQTNYLLRTTDYGYGSLPTFSLSNGDLTTLTSPPFQTEEVIYTSLPLEKNTPLQLNQYQQPKGKLSLVKGYLLAAGESVEDWTLCTGPLEQTLVSTTKQICIISPIKNFTSAAQLFFLFLALASFLVGFLFYCI